MKDLLRSIWLTSLVLLALAGAALLLRVMADWRAVWVVLALAVVARVGLEVVRLSRPKRVVEIDLQHGVVERLPDDWLMRMSPVRVVEVGQVLEALDRAGRDTYVAGVLLKLAPIGLGMAHAQELADAVVRLRERGKWAVAWSPTLGEGRAANGEMLLAAACNEVHLQPGGDVGLVGLALQQPYARGLLDKIGIKPQLDGREQYKTARYPFTEYDMPQPARESLSAVLGSQMRQLCDAIARGRGLTAQTVRTLVDDGPLLGTSAVEAKLIDRLSHRDEVETEHIDEPKLERVEMMRYLAEGGGVGGRARGPAVAVIHAVGAITRGYSGRRRLPGTVVLGAESVVAALRLAVRSKKIRAILLRIDSPGGSAVASETIWREVVRAREAGKPVVVSMSNVAASGGYYIAAGADRIIAEPGTITGSIGVVSGKMVTRAVWEKLGVNWRGVREGDNALIWSSHEDFSEAGWQKLQTMLDAIYLQFKERVAEGRGLSLAEVEAVAQGRIWTGEDAKARRLVDDLGGMDRAMAHIRELLKLPAESRVRLVPIPARRRWLTLPGWLRPTSTDASTSTSLEQLAELMEPLIDDPRDSLRLPSGLWRTSSSWM